MSDIYLSLTETPAVVTLSQPVISGALSSSVTVTNVVSVNVVTMPAINVTAAAPSVTTVVGTVAVSNFPASSSVTIGGFSTSSLPPSTVTVANSVTINGTVTASQFFTVVTSQTISFASTVTSTEAFNTGTDYDFVLMQTNLFNGGNLGTVYIDRYTSPTGSGGSGNYSLWDDTNKKAFIGGTGNNLCMDGNSIITLLQTGFPSQFYYRFRTVDATGGISGSAKLYAIKSIYPYSASIFKPWDLGKVPVAGNVYLTNSTITIGNSVTIGSLPAISGTVTAQLGSNPFATSVTVQTITGGQNGSPVAYGDQLGIYEVNLSAPGSYCIQSGFLAGPNFVNAVTLSLATPFSETVVTSASGLGGLLFRRPSIDSNNTHFRITATTTGMTPAPFTATVRAISDAYYGLNRSVSGTVTVSNSVTIGSLPAISGTVTVGAMPSGSLTTRFGTPTTANTAFATSAVTNANRKYLLIQNVTTGSNVITVGIGFTPTTTQGIQLTAGAGITFESSYIPTGQIFVLSSVTASNFTILEA